MTPVPKFIRFLFKNAVPIHFKDSHTVRIINRIRIFIEKLF
jgi:hypothetical protein